MIEKYYIFYLLAFISEIVGTISGFGSSIMFVTLASLFFEFKSVLGILAVFHVFSNVSKIFLFRKGVDKKIASWVGVPAVIFVSIGAWLTTFIQTDILVVIMNILLVLLSIFLVSNIETKIEATNKNLVLGGISSGIIAGLTGTGGAIRGLTLAAFHLKKEIFIATSAFIDLWVDLSRATIYLYNGYYKKEYIVMLPYLLVISILGTYTGKQILQFTSEKAFRIIVILVVVLSSVFQLLSYFEVLHF